MPISPGAIPREYNKVLTETASWTVSADDNGKVFLLGAADLVATLPKSAPGLRYAFILTAAGLSAGTGFQITPNGTDTVMGDGFASAAGKGAVLAGASDREGDMIELLADGNGGWYIVDVIGTWSRQP